MSTINDMKAMLNDKLESLLATKQQEIFAAALGAEIVDMTDATPTEAETAAANESTDTDKVIEENTLEKIPKVVLDNDDLPIDADKKKRIELIKKAGSATNKGPIDKSTVSSIKLTGANESEEQLDEVSKAILGRYIKKASTDAANKSASKRIKGISKAVDKLASK